MHFTVSTVPDALSIVPSLKFPAFKDVLSCFQGKRKKRKRENKPDSKPEGKRSSLLVARMEPFFYYLHVIIFLILLYELCSFIYPLFPTNNY